MRRAHQHPYSTAPIHPFASIFWNISPTHPASACSKPSQTAFLNEIVLTEPVTVVDTAVDFEDVNEYTTTRELRDHRDWTPDTPFYSTLVFNAIKFEV